MTGRIKLHRQSQDNPMYFAEPFTKWMAWVDLIMTASFKDGVIVVRGNIIEVKRGQNGYSEDTLSVRRKWSRNKVRRYLNYLETIQQIVQQKSKVKSIITIINYEKYQGNDTTDDTTERHQTIQQTDTIKKDKKEKEGKETITTIPKVSFSDEIADLQKHWNDLDAKYKIPQAKVVSVKAKQRYAALRKTFDFDMIIEGFEKYISVVEKKKPGDKYYDHRYSLSEFIVNGYGLEKYAS